MKPFSALVCCVVALLAYINIGHALTIPASEDSSSFGSRLSIVGNKSGVLSVDATRKAYVYFDLSEIPTTAVVRWAKLRLFLPVVRVKGSGVNVHTVTGEWNEALQSVEPSISSNPVGTIGPDKIATKRFVTVDVTSTVQDWINLKTSNEGFAFVSISNVNPSLTSVISFSSKEGIMGGLPAELDMDFEASVPQELKGSKGDTGLAGATGPQGPAGASGPTGPQGPQGLTGATGAMGPQGVAGLDGKTILNGTTAPAGSVGNIGDFYFNTAASAIYGPKTASGWGSGTSLVGPQGSQGVQGAKGDIGLTGATGPQGPIGATGPQGAKGDNGATGPSGVQGPQGLMGATGPQGTAGLDGKTVLNGTMAPSSAVGSTGDFYLNTAASALYGPKTASGWGSAASLLGPQGAQGLKGDIGATGPTGPQGLQGPAGAIGPQGLQGVKGDAGATGPTGLQGLQGPAGATGPQGPAGSAAAAGTVLYRPYLSGEPPTSTQPSAMNFQGVLVEGGLPVNGMRNFAIKLFDAAIDGTELYSETIGSVPVVNGVYSFEYGVAGTSNAMMTETVVTTDGTKSTFQKILSVSSVVNGSVTIADGTYTWNQTSGSSDENSFDVSYNSSLRRIVVNYFGGAPVVGKKIIATYRAPTSGISAAISASMRPWIETSVNGSVQSIRQKLLTVPFAAVAQSVVGLEEVKSNYSSVTDEVAISTNFIQAINASGISVPMHLWETTKGGYKKGINSLIQDTTHATYDAVNKVYVSKVTGPTESYNAGSNAGVWNWVELSSGSVSACITGITFKATLYNWNYNSIEARLYYEDGTFASKTGISNGTTVNFVNPSPEKYVTKLSLWGGTSSSQSQGATFSNAVVTLKNEQDRYVDVDISSIGAQISASSLYVDAPYISNIVYSLFSGTNETKKFALGSKSLLPYAATYQKLRIYLIPTSGSTDLSGTSLQSISFRYW